MDIVETRALDQTDPLINFWDAQLFENPDLPMRWLLRNAPVYRCDPPDYPGGPFWVVSKWADIRAVHENLEIFTTRFGVHLGEGIFSSDHAEREVEKRASMPADPRLKIAMKPVSYYDAPEHTRLRALARAVFRPKRVHSFEAATLKIVDRVLDALPVGQPFDIARALAWIPVRVVCEVLGVGETRSEDFMQWAEAIFSSYEPDTPPNFHKILEMFDYLEGELESRRMSPREDALSDFVAAEYQGSKLSNDECLMWSWMLLAGGQDTTTNLLTTGLRALLEHPAEYRRLVNDPSLIPNGVIELLRWVVPDRNMGRTATCDTMIGDVAIAKGDFILLNYVAGNRDPDAFEHPDLFDIGRELRNDHLSFGFGAHYCPGQLLAKLEMRIFLERFTARFPNAVISGPVSSLPSIRLAKTRQLTVTLG